ncbi:MAG: hypothetical protein AAGA23_12695 [Pseudomonadota bacterium]
MTKNGWMLMVAALLAAGAAAARPGPRDPAADVIQTLSLSGEQATQVTEIFEAARIERDLDREQRAADRCARHVAIQAQLATVLSAEQLDELDRVREERHARQRSERKEPGRGPGDCDA